MSEKQFEELVRKSSGLIEEGLCYIDHQKKTERGPLDVLFVDSGKSLVVAELKVIEDDGMLMQGLDYYDYVTSNIEGYARAYKEKGIDPVETPRLFLISPSFSVSLLNRCKWIDIPISLFTFQCLAFDERPEEIIPVFKEVTIPSRPKHVEVYTLEQKLNDVTDSTARKTLEELLKDIKAWNTENIAAEPIKYDISIKVSGSVLAYISPRRKHFVVTTYDADGDWKSFPIRSKRDLKNAKTLLRNYYDELSRENQS